MQTLLNSRESGYAISFALEKVDSIELENFKPFFRDMPIDPYIKGQYRSRRLSRFQVTDHDVIKLPHGYLFQSKQYNPLLVPAGRRTHSGVPGPCSGASPRTPFPHPDPSG